MIERVGNAGRGGADDYGARNSMLAFDVSIHVRAASVEKGPPWNIAEVAVETLAPDASQLATPFTVSFEDASDALARLERMFIEPDGAYVWTGASGGEPWQVEGSLYDRAGRLLYVTAKGRCPEAAFDRLLTAMGWPETPVLLQLTRQAVFLSEEGFREAARERC